MITSVTGSRQPLRQSWTRERLEHERAIALGQSIDSTTWSNYSSALNSYLEFVKNHNFPIDPTPDTLSFYTVYMSHYIKPASVDTYLSGICQQLEPFFPDVRKNRKSMLVHRTIAGCKRIRAIPTKRKRALTIDDLSLVLNSAESTPDHDDLLFHAQLVIGFFALLRLGELTYPDNQNLQNPQKISKRTTVQISENSFQFFLPGHKADRFFEGNSIVLLKNNSSRIPVFQNFDSYLTSRDKLFPYHSPLWLMSNGSVPTRTFFIRRLRQFFDSDVSGHSLRAGGATWLALANTPPSIIQAAGRWSSNSFQIYIRKNPLLIHALMQTPAPQTI
jgi:integrase